MISALPKLKEALNKRADLAEVKNQPADIAIKSRSGKVKKTDRSQMENLADAAGVDIKFEGNPEDQIIVFDLDETLIAGDKNPIDKKREAKINAMGDRKVETVAKDHPMNERGTDIKYVLRPGAKELLEYLDSRGYKMIACTRNYADRGDAICDHDPVLKKYISGCLGRKDLKSKINTDFKKYPHHPDNIGFSGKVKGFFKNALFMPKFLWMKTKSIFNGANIRWTSEIGSMGKYPPNMLELLAAKGNTKLQGLKAPHFLVDNSDKRETRDSKISGDWAYINSNVDKNGDGKSTAFFATDEAPKIELADPETQETKEGYEWVKKVIDGVEAGWKDTYKETTGKDPNS